MKKNIEINIKAHTSVIKKFESRIEKIAIGLAKKHPQKSAASNITTTLNYKMTCDDSMPLDRAIVNGRILNFRDNSVMEILKNAR